MIRLRGSLRPPPNGLRDRGCTPGVIDVKDVSCADQIANPGAPFHILLNTTPDPLPGQDFADPDLYVTEVYMGDGVWTGAGSECGPSGFTDFTVAQPWNLNVVFDFAFIVLDRDGFLDILFGTCSGMEFWSMQCFTSAQNYCETSPNSVGSGAVIGWSGDLDIDSPTPFTVKVKGAPANESGRFFFGPTQDHKPFGNGFECVGGAISRFDVQTTDGEGTASLNVDFTSSPGDLIGSGVGINFQFWYRDPQAGGSFFNLSNGLQAVFCPGG